LEIRAKISLAVDSFKQGVKSVTSGYEQVAKAAKAADELIAKSSKTTAESRRAYAMQSANGEMAEIRKVERAAIEANKRIQDSYKSITPNKLPLATVQQSSRSTVTATTGTQGLPARKTAESVVAQIAAENKAYRDMVDAKIKADAEFYAKKAQQAQQAAAQGRTIDAQIAAANARVRKENQIAGALNSPDFERNLASIRYALYDVGGRAIAFSSTIVAAIGDSVKAFADLESSFTSVERVTLGLSEGALQSLRQSLIDISTSAPIAFDEIAKIATLGGQMGISADALAGFSETVAQFSAITGISADQAAQSFGRLAQMMGVPVTKFENLSSSILYAGVNSVATDREILAMAESIGSAGTQAGMSADQVIGLSTALASLKVRPEEARGVILRLFRTIDVEVSNGGSKLNDYANVLGLVTDAAGTAGTKAAQLWKQNPNEFFTSFLKGAQSAGDLNSILQDLGITNTRELNVISKLAGNTDLLSKSLGDARKQYLLGSYATDAFAVANDDLNSKMKMLSSAVTEFQAKFGESLAPALGVTLDILKMLAKGVAAIPAPIKALAGVIGLVVAGAIALGGGLAIGIAGMLAMKLAIDRMNTSVTGVGINLTTFKMLFRELTADFGIGAASANAFSNTLIKVGFSADTVAVATNKAGIAMGFLQKSMGWIALALTAVTVVWSMVDAHNAAQQSALELGDAMIQAGGGSEALAKAISADNQAYAETGQAIGELAASYNAKDKADKTAELRALATAEAIDSQVNGIRNATIEHGKIANAADIGTEANKKYAQSLGAINSELDSSTSKMGVQTAAFIADALAKYKGKEGKDATIFETLLNPKAAKATKLATTLGFNLGELISAGMKKSGGAQEYANSTMRKIAEIGSVWVKDGEAGVRKYGQSLNLTEKQITSIINQLSSNSAELQMGRNGSSANILQGAMNNAAQGVDSVTKASAQNKAIVDIQTQALIDMGYEAGTAADMVGGLSEALRGYVTSSSSTEAANNAAADSFATYAKGISDTSDGLAGSRQDFSNWSSYMQSAVDAAIASGTGFAGSVTQMITAIKALSDAGKDTKKPFEDMRQYIVNAANGEGYSKLGDKIKAATDPKQLKGIIQSWINLQDGETNAGKKAIAYGIALQGALAYSPELLKILAAGFDGVTTSAGTAKTALEKLQEQITKTFAAMNARNDLRASLMALGKSLQENGTNFNTWTEAGQSNTKAVQDAIDKLAVTSKGKLGVFGADLKALRQALINTGNGTPQALAIIDKELKKIGKSGKASKADIAAFTAALKNMSTAQNAVIAVADSINALAGSVMNYLNASWMLGNTQMQIAAGWEQITGTASQAANAVADVSAELNKIQADKGILQYQLQVALKYGDTLRANELRAQIADLTAQAAQVQADHDKAVAEAAAAASKVSTTPAQDLLQQQQALQQMVGYYVQMGSAEVISAKNKEDAQAAVEGTVKAFEDQARAAGVSEENVKKYSDELRKGLDLAKELNKPVAYKVNAATSAALTEIRAFRDKATAAINQIPKTVTIKVNTVGAVPNSVTITGVKAATGGLIRGPGSATSDSIPAQLSNGEFVMSARAVSSYGVDFMNSLNNMKMSAPSIGSQLASAMSGSSMVYLSPEDRSLLRAAIDRPINLYTDNQRIAASANAGNVILAQRGSH
jgi:TP901 family phage tail tape measure protein